MQRPKGNWNKAREFVECEGMCSLEHYENFIREKVEKDRWTYQQISSSLQATHPGLRGFSARSIRRFCSHKDIHKTQRINDQQLDEAVSRATDMVRNALSSSCRPVTYERHIASLAPTANSIELYTLIYSCRWVLFTAEKL